MREFLELAFVTILSVIGALLGLVMVGAFIAIPLAMVLWVLRWFSLI